ncbi:MAG: hypothetical protein AAFR87_12575 [Bacteroidota bacterium]
MRKYYQYLLLLSAGLLICFACEENPTEPDPPTPPEPLVLEGYYIGTSDYEEYTYRTEYFHVPSMTFRDTFFVLIDTAYMSDPDTITVRKVDGDTLYYVDWQHADKLYPFLMGPLSRYSEEDLLRGPGMYQDYDVDLRFSMHGFGTDSLEVNYLFEHKFELEVMADKELSFRTLRKEPLD